MLVIAYDWLSICLSKLHLWCSFAGCWYSVLVRGFLVVALYAITPVMLPLHSLPVFLLVRCTSLTWVCPRLNLWSYFENGLLWKWSFYSFFNVFLTLFYVRYNDIIYSILSWVLRFTCWMKLSRHGPKEKAF